MKEKLKGKNHYALIAMGSNKDMMENFSQALKFIRSKSEIIKIKEISQFLYNEAIDFDTYRPPFLNCVLRIETTFDLQSLTGFFKEIEKKQNRNPTKQADFETIDVDILLYDGEPISKQLTDSYNLFLISSISKINPIVICDENSVIGDGVSHPWEIPSEYEQYKLTMRGQSSIIIGKNSFILSRGSHKNKNIFVISQRKNWEEIKESTGFKLNSDNGCHVECVESFGEAVAKSICMDNTIWVCGGTRCYAESLPISSEIYVSVIHKNGSSSLGKNRLLESGTEVKFPLSINELTDNYPNLLPANLITDEKSGSIYSINKFAGPLYGNIGCQHLGILLSHLKKEISDRNELKKIALKTNFSAQKY
ncbi:dihydrofolate reductase [Yersinia mollaretii]|uniref:dihydrofolate reductase n=1 Tax=Yersinia mollaretii TaxID=33060 RepID=UPI0005E3E489|nr:dihydrofolate reductase [Yersinia mollaretii]CNF67263.1 Dihydrofolate reductase [Yersinia mollaretii]CQJ32873.1 Dihydrofolate reductase [Yersinia mollaretii]